MRTRRLEALANYPLLASLLLGTGAWAQMDFSSIYTQTVKTGQPWAQIETKVDSVAVKIEVNRGVVTTRATFSYTPGQGLIEDWQCVASACPSPDVRSEKDTLLGTCPLVCEYGNGRVMDMDSLETSQMFSLSANSMITDMTLWVGEIPVKAALQERALASAQYESIVQRRRDPALLETWGNGNYNLRIFPGKSGETRKLEIEFVQGIENDEGKVAAILPVIQSLAKVVGSYRTQAEYDKAPYRSIGSIKIEAIASDGKTYELEWPGLGSGKITGTGIQFSAKNISEIKPGKVSIAAANCVNCLTPWTASHSGADYFGAKATLIGKQLKFAKEPMERDVILDIATSKDDAKLVDRARKIALLSLKAYAGEPYKGNLGFSDGKGTIRYVFPKPTSMNNVELIQAYDALLQWVPTSVSDAQATMLGFAKSRGIGDEPCVLYLINNDTTLFYDYSGNWSEAQQIKAREFERALAQKDSVTAATLKASNAQLFGFWNNYRLSQVANQTGGYQLGSMQSYGFYRNNYRTVQTSGTIDSGAVKSPEEPFRNLQLPPLFGLDRFDAYSLTDLTMVPKSSGITNFIFYQGQNFYGRYLIDDMVLDKKATTHVAALAKASRSAHSANSIAPYDGSVARDSMEIRFAGNYAGSGRAVFVITGLWGGLRFTTEVEVELPANGSTVSSKGAGIWGYQQGEILGQYDDPTQILAIQNLGKEFHIVNRQMSLLALEPGMDLWTELPSKVGQSNGTRVSDASMEVDTLPAMPNVSIDDVSLEAILKDFVPILQGAAARITQVGAITQRRVGNQLELFWNIQEAKEPATFQIVQMSGKEMARITGSPTQNGFTAIWAAPAHRGQYFIIAKSGRSTRIQSLALP